MAVTPPIPPELWDSLPPDAQTAVLGADACPHCQTTLSGEDPNPRVHQVLEIPQLRPDVTHYRQHCVTCPKCQRVAKPPLPAEVRGGFGPRVQAICVLLCGTYRITKRGVTRLFDDVFGLPISAAMVCKLQHATAETLAPIVRELREHVAGQPVNLDETSWRQTGEKNCWLWTAVTRWVSVFRISLSRRRENLKILIPGELGTVTSDRFGVYNHLKGRDRQVCWAHLRRDIQAMIDRNDAGSEVGQELLACSDRLFEHWQRVRDGTLSREEFAKTIVPTLRSEVPALLWRGWHCGAKRTHRVCGEIQLVEASLWTFAYVAGVEPTNSAAERALRQGVYWRKTSYGTDSVQGSRFVEGILSVVETCRQQGRRVLAFLVEAIKAAKNQSVRPSLIPIAP